MKHTKNYGVPPRCAVALVLATILLLTACSGQTGPVRTTKIPGTTTDMNGNSNTQPGGVETTDPFSSNEIPSSEMTDILSEEITTFDKNDPKAPQNNLAPFAVAHVPNVSKGTGGSKLPATESEPSALAPVISELTDMTFPDETLAIAGYRLDNLRLIMWSEGKLKSVIPLRSDGTKAEAVIPSDMSKSVTLIWPYDENGVGAPVRINAPDVYWADPGTLVSGKSGQEIRFFGSGLSISGKTPIIVAEFSNGKTETLRILNSDPYQIMAAISTEIPAGDVTFYLHNGTGGNFGWSDAVTVKTADSAVLSRNELNVFHPEDYGATPDDGEDDLKGIRDAISAAAKEGGGVVELKPGKYVLSSVLAVTSKFPKGLYIIGAGMGSYDMGSSLSHDEYDYEGLTGAYTLIKFLSPETVKSHFIQIVSENVFISGLTIIGGDNGDHNSNNVFVSGKNLNFDSVRFVKTDLRDFAGSGEISVGCNFEIDNVSSEITVSNCEFHQQGSAINIGNIEGIWPWGFFDSSRTVRNVRIRGCHIYGYAGPYTAPDGRSAGDLGELSRGFIGFNLQGLIFENNTVRGYDKEHCKLLVRSIYVNATSEMMYIANNTMEDVGNVPESGFDLNTGEQILIHGNDFTGGIFNVLSDEGDSVTVRTDNIENSEASPYSKSDNTGSRLFSGLEKGDRGNLYVYSGKGVGQSRKVIGYKKAAGKLTFILDRPFTVPLDETSIVDLISFSSHNIIYGNHIGNREVILHEGLKTGGVLLFFQGGYNIIAENEFKNLTFGVAINARFKGPTIWNTVRDNSFSGMTELRPDAAQGGDSTYNATFFCVSVVKNSPEGWDDYNAWYAVGNVFRGNKCEKGDYSAELTTNRWNRSPNEWISYFGEEKGAAMSIIENNTFSEVKTGVLVGNPDYWSIIRNNTFSYSTKPGYRRQTATYEQKQTNFYMLVIENNKVAADANKTFNKNGGASVDIN